MGAVEDLTEDLERLGEARTRAVEVPVAVEQVHAFVSNGTKLAKVRALDKRGEFAARLRQSEAAGRDEEHVGIGRAERRPVEPLRASSRLSEQRLRAGEGHELGQPVTRAH